uniref:BAP29/BAP31 transmembrane domain-containing protein n=1 Tax=Alexandrium catenella TaxID=2925 RepID=A0A7S1WSA9_ALECA|mmetsp:Transcript_85945/g.228432  ORF Transcript_85945/g.228432 Transcript_85945/m.228432 type:complete len:189 (+) Transcript_85945:74-640(+)
MALMVGLAYVNLLVPWLPLLILQSIAILWMGRTMQSAVRGLSKLLIDTPLCNFYKILWVAMLVLFLDCLRQVLMPRSPDTSGTAADAERMYEQHAAREGALAWALNLVTMLAAMALHVINGQTIKIEMDRDIMKKQAAQQGEFTKRLLEADEKKAEATATPETKMPTKEAKEAAESKDDDNEELRKRS